MLDNSLQHKQPYLMDIHDIISVDTNTETKTKTKKKQGKKIQKTKYESVLLPREDHVLFQRHHPQQGPKDHQLSRQDKYEIKQK